MTTDPKYFGIKRATKVVLGKLHGENVRRLVDGLESAHSAYEARGAHVEHE